MSISLRNLAVLAFMGFVSVAQAAETPSAQIHFNELDGVSSCRSGGEATVFVKDRMGQWYKADLAETCMSLDTKKGISFLTETDPDTKVKTSKVTVDHHICIVTSMSKVASPAVPKP